MKKNERLESFAKKLAKRRGWKWGYGCCFGSPEMFVSTRSRVLGENLLLLSNKDMQSWTHCGSYDEEDEVFHLMVKDVNCGRAFDILKERILNGSQRPYTSGRGLLDGVRKWGGPVWGSVLQAYVIVGIALLVLLFIGKLLFP